LKLNQLKADVAGLHSDIEFDKFWSEVTNNSHLLDVDEPKAKKLPRRLDENPDTQHNFTSVNDVYIKQYFQFVDTMKSSFV